jgi:hypothetical protein
MAMQNGHVALTWAMGRDIGGVIGIKCAGQNNFNTNHFSNLLISGLFKA